jgi:putative SOS response-associated peptidase YedK
MCAQYTLKVGAIELTRKFRLFREIGSYATPFRVVPFAPSIVIVGEKGERVGRTMRFSLIPKWSKESKPKFATYNARLHSKEASGVGSTPIYEKPTWREPFRKRHCLVPISEFIEPAYTGRLAGHMIRFSQDDDTVLAAAGIWEEWIDRKSGEVIDSFAILTDEPDPYVQDLGHDRMPVFLSEDAFDEWLFDFEKNPSEMLSLLERRRASLHLTAESDRQMKPGWEKRVSQDRA